MTSTNSSSESNSALPIRCCRAGGAARGGRLAPGRGRLGFGRRASWPRCSRRSASPAPCAWCRGRLAPSAWRGFAAGAAWRGRLRRARAPGFAAAPGRGAASPAASSSATRRGERLDLGAQPAHVLEDAQVVEALADPLRGGARPRRAGCDRGRAPPRCCRWWPGRCARPRRGRRRRRRRASRPLSFFAAFLSFLGMVAAVYVSVSAPATIHLRPHEEVAERVLAPGRPGPRAAARPAAAREAEDAQPQPRAVGLLGRRRPTASR